MSHAYEDITDEQGDLLHQAVQCGHIQWITQEELSGDSPIRCTQCSLTAPDPTWRRAVVLA